MISYQKKIPTIEERISLQSSLIQYFFFFCMFFSVFSISFILNDYYHSFVTNNDKIFELILVNFMFLTSIILIIIFTNYEVKMSYYKQNSPDCFLKIINKLFNNNFFKKKIINLYNFELKFDTNDKLDFIYYLYQLKIYKITLIELKQLKNKGTDLLISSNNNFLEISDAKMKLVFLEDKLFKININDKEYLISEL